MTKLKKRNANGPERLSANCDSPDTSSEESIRARAYELYEQRGGADGHAEDDWLRAEAEISARHSQPKAPEGAKE